MPEFAPSPEQFKPPVQEQQPQQPQQTVEADLPTIPNSAGEQKIEEYVNRIKGGESKESIFQGLPESFKSGIEKRLAEPVEEKVEQDVVGIPPQYRGVEARVRNC